jgi:hypothetical protein
MTTGLRVDIVAQPSPSGTTLLLRLKDILLDDSFFFFFFLPSNWAPHGLQFYWVD